MGWSTHCRDLHRVMTADLERRGEWLVWKVCETETGSISWLMTSKTKNKRLKNKLTTFQYNKTNLHSHTHYQGCQRLWVIKSHSFRTFFQTKFHKLSMPKRCQSLNTHIIWKCYLLVADQSMVVSNLFPSLCDTKVYLNFLKKNFLYILWFWKIPYFFQNKTGFANFSIPSPDQEKANKNFNTFQDFQTSMESFMVKSKCSADSDSK